MKTAAYLTHHFSNENHLIFSHYLLNKTELLQVEAHKARCYLSLPPTSPISSPSIFLPPSLPTSGTLQNFIALRKKSASPLTLFQGKCGIAWHRRVKLYVFYEIDEFKIHFYLFCFSEKRPNSGKIILGFFCSIINILSSSSV